MKAFLLVLLAAALSGCRLESLFPDCPSEGGQSRVCTPTEPDPARHQGREVDPPVRESER
jgi:hypothetical protein